jgi:hypothetical protein
VRSITRRSSLEAGGTQDTKVGRSGET